MLGSYGVHLFSALRKLRNAIELQRRWISHCARSPSKVEAVGDFARWLWTSVPRPGPPHVPAGPWITFDAERWLRGHVRDDMRVFEWGSGGSTVFFASRVREVVSVEHDPRWHALVAARLAALRRHNVDAALVAPEPPGVDEVPLPFRSTDAAYVGLSFEKYVRAIERFPDGHFDVVLVDGRARLGCLERALRKVRPGGAVVVDNSERADMAAVLDALEPTSVEITHFEGPAPRNFWPGFWRTSVLRPREVAGAIAHGGS